MFIYVTLGLLELSLMTGFCLIIEYNQNLHLLEGLDSTNGCASMFDQMIIFFGVDTSGTMYLDLGNKSSKVIVS